MASSNIKVQFDGLEELQKMLENMDKEREKLMIDTLKDLAKRLLNKAVKRTPVDSGDLRRSWTVSEVKKNGNNYEIIVKNSKEYASYVEYGHRQEVGRFVPAIKKRLDKPWVEGQFMLTISEHELETQAPAIIEKKVSEWLKQFGG